VLSNMVAALVEQPSARLLKHIVRCYLRLADNIRAREALRQCLPDALRDETFAECLREDLTTKRWLQQLVLTISEVQSQVGTAHGGQQQQLGAMLHGPQ
jgi:CCR4-NOT transcription complex subunit 9